MEEIKIEQSEEKIIEVVKKSANYQEFKNNYFNAKIKRERKAWEMLKANRGNYTQDILNNIFDTVDLFETNRRWFGLLLTMPNRNSIFKTPLGKINKWIETLLFSDNSLDFILENCLINNKIKGASHGLVTLLLYIKSPKSYNICLPKIQDGLHLLGRIDTFKYGDFIKYYKRFNQEVIKLRDRYKFQPEEMDWLLTNVQTVIIDEPPPNGGENGEEFETREFAYERDLRNFLAKNLNVIESGMVLYEEGETVGIEYNAGGRYIDILTLDKDNNFVVIELKVSKGYDRVIGQLLRYMAWVRNHLSTPKQKVKGIIIANEITEDLILAASQIDDVRLFEYNLSITLNKVQ